MHPAARSRSALKVDEILVPEPIKKELRKGEKVTWVGQPSSKLLFIFGLPFTLFGLCIVISQAVALIANSSQGGNYWVGPVINTVLYFPVACASSVGWFIAKKMHYAVTTQSHLIVIEYGGSVERFDNDTLVPFARMDVLNTTGLWWRAPGVKRVKNSMSYNKCGFWALPAEEALKLGAESFPRMVQAHRDEYFELKKAATEKRLKGGNK